MSETALAAPAKINLHLEVLGRDRNGYHLLETLFQTLELHDELVVRLRSDGAISLSCDDDGLPDGPENLAWRAAEAYRDACGERFGVDIAIRKRIPAGGGLGGGSSDAAAVLRALEGLYHRPIGERAMQRLAAGLGADVAFFLLGGTAHGTDRGEQLSPLPDLPPHDCTLLVPALHCSTPAVYGALSEAERGPRSARGPKHWPDRLDDLPLHNRLAAAAQRRYPELGALMQYCAASGQRWLLSGSGASCVVFGAIDAPPGVTAIATSFRSRARLDALAEDEQL